MQVKIRVRSGTSEEWAAKNPVLLLAEPGYDSTARILKIGDGSSTWSELPETNIVDDAPSPTGRAVLKAADPTAARAAIGAVASVNGQLPDSSGNVYVPTGGGGGAVDSVNGRTGDVTLDAAAVNALPDTYVPPVQTWGQIPDKPTTFTPTAHSHAIADVTNLQAALDGKQAAGSYATAVHTHTIANVTGLQTALDGKAATGHTHPAQTLSLAGSDLTLSGGGGTVTLPAGGGGGATGAVQFAVARAGAATALAQSTFTTYPLDGTPTVNIGGGTWNASTFVYTIPTDGLYLCLGAIRIADVSTARNVMVAIHTSNDDGPFGLWQVMGTFASNPRSGVQYTRLTRFSAGQGVRMYIYSEGSAFTTASDGAGQSMSITKLAD